MILVVGCLLCFWSAWHIVHRRHYLWPDDLPTCRGTLSLGGWLFSCVIVVIMLGPAVRWYGKIGELTTIQVHILYVMASAVSIITMQSLMSATTRSMVFGHQRSRFWELLWLGVSIFPWVLVISAIVRVVVRYIWPESAQVEQSAIMLLLQAQRDGGLLPLCGCVACVVPYVEESIFRGILQPFLRTLLSPSWSCALTSLCFCMAHYSPEQQWGNISVITSLFVFSWIASVVRERDDSLWSSVAMHMGFNIAGEIAFFIVHR